MAKFSNYMSNSKKVKRIIQDTMYLDVVSYFLINLPQSSLRISPGQGQNNQLFGGFLVSVKSIAKSNQHTGTSPGIL